MAKLNAIYTNTTNKIKVLDLIRNSTVISRADLVRKTHLSAPTITRIVDSLINREQIVENVGTGNSAGGRPPSLIRFSGSEKFVIGIDLGATHVDGIIANLTADIISEIRIPTLMNGGYNEVIHITAQLISDLVERSGIQSSKILGIGMAVAGLVNRKRKIVEVSPDFGWHDVDIVADLQNSVPYSVVIDNVTRVAALGELHFGHGKKYNNFVFINVGYGIGAGVIVDGKPYIGAHGTSGEFGHIVIDPHSTARCLCGETGCLEALASGRGIAMAAQQRLRGGEESVLSDLFGADPSYISARAVADAAADGDELSLSVLQSAFRYLGLGVVNLVNLFDPDAIIIGGGVAESGELLFETIQEVVSERSLSRHSRELKIVPASFGLKASVMGAVSLVLGEVLSFRMKMA
jgi:glucokinase-like ROK family protein